MSEKKEDKNIEVYFNSACPVCNAGIHYQKNRIGDVDLSDGCPSGDESTSDKDSNKNSGEYGGQAGEELRGEQRRVESPQVSWVDISSVSNKDNMLKCSRVVDQYDGHSRDIDDRIANSNIEFVKERLHVIDQDNNVHIGMDAFIIIWTLSPKDRRKAKFFSIPIIHALSVISYNIFAWLLYRWNRLLKRW